MLTNNYLNKNRSSLLKTKLEKIISYEPEDIINNLDKLKSLKSYDFKEINGENNIILGEKIMNLFENYFLIYFNCIEKLNTKTKQELFPKYFQNVEQKNYVLFDLSLKLFKQTISFLDKITYENNEKSNVCKLYSIVFVKLYLYKVICFTKNDFSEINNYKEMFKVINDITNKNFKYVIYIYILKLYYYYLDNNLELLKYLFDMKLYNIFDTQFYSLFDEDNTIITNYYLFPLEKEKYKNYINYLKEFENIKRDKFADEGKTKQFIINLLNRKNLDTFIIISINKIFFELYSNYDKNKNENYNKFFLIARTIITDYNQNNGELIKLLNLFYNTDIFLEKIFPNLKNNKILEILLYGFRYCVKSIFLENNSITNGLNTSIENKQQYFYKSLLSKNYSETLDNAYIPGIDIKEYLHLVTLETIIEHLNTKPDRHGCYVCSCGYYYDIDPCGFPTKNRTFKCPVCGLDIGWGPKPVKAGEESHGMVIRPGHLRIFKDEKAKKYQMKVFDEVDENIPNMILSDYIQNIIEPIRQKNEKGFVKCSKNFFEKTNKKIRNLSQIGYRLLNYILYCHLFFGYSIGNIPENNLKQYLIDNMNIIEIIETNWRLLKESLYNKRVNSIQIFMNLIFDEISDLIKNNNNFNKVEEREKFEDEVEKIILKYIEKYNDYSDKYIEENKLQIKFENYYSVETIITELIPIKEEIYKEKDYPMFKYFNLTKYRSKLDCFNHIPDKNKYSLTYQLLSDNKQYLNLNYLPIFNDFINYMNKKYSFKITREEAHKRKLKDEEIFTKEEFIEKFNKFRKIWSKIKSYAIKYKCDSELPEKDLDSEDSLSYFLNEISEYSHGMYLSAASQSFIGWQNSFLSNILENNSSKESILYQYTNSIKNLIGVNEANNNQILLIEERIEKSEYNDIEHIILIYSERNIYKNDKTNYNSNEYNNFTYNYDKIEEELGKIILPGVQMFKSEDNLNLVIYWGEGFKGKRSQILIEFCMKYGQRELDENQKEIIFNYIKEKIINKDIIKQIFSFMQMLIIYLSTKKDLIKDLAILSLIKSLSIDFDFPQDVIDFFIVNEKIIAVDNLIDIYIIFEYLCFEDLIMILKDEYKKDIDENIKKDITYKIQERLENKEINYNLIFSIKNFAIAIRRLISRYLVGSGELNDIKPESELYFELSREDLWNEQLKNIDNLNEKIYGIIGDWKLKVNEAFCLYKLIVNDNKNEIKDFYK